PPPLYTLSLHAALPICSEILVRHRVALHMPAGATIAPGARPRRLVSLRPLPQGEVERIFLRARGGRPLDHDVLELLVRQDPERVDRKSTRLNSSHQLIS